MSKKGRERSLSDTEAKAVARMLRVSPQKLNLLAQLIRGKKVAAALADLEFSRKRIARDVRKCLESAIANAENNHDLDVDDLVVAEAHVWGRSDALAIEFWVDGVELPVDIAAELVAWAFGHPEARPRHPVLVCLPRDDADRVLRCLIDLVQRSLGGLQKWEAARPQVLAKEGDRLADLFRAPDVRVDGRVGTGEHKR